MYIAHFYREGAQFNPRWRSPVLSNHSYVCVPHTFIVKKSYMPHVLIIVISECMVSTSIVQIQSQISLEGHLC